jgi:hypothetical protein
MHKSAKMNIKIENSPNKFALRINASNGENSVGALNARGDGRIIFRNIGDGQGGNHRCFFGAGSVD